MVSSDLTIFTVYVDSATLRCCLVPCVQALSCSPAFIALRSTGPMSLAAAYNRLLYACRTRFVMFAHPDTIFSEDVLRCADGIYQEDRIGAMGIVGKGHDRETYWANAIAEPVSVSTLDSCCIIVDRKHGMRFDSRVFDGLHLCVEDYCCQVRAVRRDVLVLVDPAAAHGSVTVSQRGTAWGGYWMYRVALERKWALLGVETT